MRLTKEILRLGLSIKLEPVSREFGSLLYEYNSRNEVAYWYGERASTGLLAAVAWSHGVWVFDGRVHRIAENGRASEFRARKDQSVFREVPRVLKADKRCTGAFWYKNHQPKHKGKVYPGIIVVAQFWSRWTQRKRNSWSSATMKGD
jgi:hypothetical protein